MKSGKLDKNSKKPKGRKFENDTLEAYRHIRKPMPKPTSIMKTVKEYKRSDRSWLKE